MEGLIYLLATVRTLKTTNLLNIWKNILLQVAIYWRYEKVEKVHIAIYWRYNKY